MKIAIGSDHAGYEYKNKIINYLTSKKLPPQDCGCYSNDSVDYPDISNEVCSKLIQNICQYGILICGSGIGMSIAANRNNGIRAALCLTSEMAKLSKEHNNANILVLASRLTPFEEAIIILESFLNSKFEGGRHIQRIEKLEKNL